MSKSTSVLDEATVAIVEAALNGTAISMTECERIMEKIDALKMELRRSSVVTSADRQRWSEKDLRRKDELNGRGCDVCGPFLPGIRFPVERVSRVDLAMVERCDHCDLFEDDIAAAHVVARMLNTRVELTSDSKPFIVGFDFEEATKAWSTLEDARAGLVYRRSFDSTSRSSVRRARR